jgi:ATP-grasp domain-containing protein
LVEQLTLNQRAVGSTPTRPTKFFSHLRVPVLFESLPCYRIAPTFPKTGRIQPILPRRLGSIRHVFGLSGIHVEILGDVQFRITPLTEDDAMEMIRGIKGHSLLTGYRGQQPADIKAIEEVLLRISRLVEEIPEIYELDLNPIFALSPGKGCRIVDARIGVSRSENVGRTE